MADYADPQLVNNNLDNALEQLETSLAEAGRSLSAVRHNVTQLASLVEVVREMEDMMNKARATLGMESIATSTQPALRPVPQQEPFLQPIPEPIAALPEIEEVPSPEPQPEPIEIQVEPEPQRAVPGDGFRARLVGSEPARARDAELDQHRSDRREQGGEVTSHCLRLGVASKAGSLDLKAVDGSVSENPAVVDIALLDYDGRKATLKLWINGSADPVGVRDALLGSLRRRLGDESAAEVQIEFERAA